jgi:hypothetical protein
MAFSNKLRPFSLETFLVRPKSQTKVIAAAIKLVRAGTLKKR